jgi:hypothetical protein
MKHEKELPKLLRQGGAPQLMQRWQRLDVDHDINDLAGYNVFGTVRFIDRDFFRALFDPAYAEQIGIGPVDTGLSPEHTVECLLTHEGVEKVLIDADNDIDAYLDAHEYATCAEHEQVRKLGGQPLQYERGLAKGIKFCEAKDPTKVARDYDACPLLDDPDANDKRVLKTLRSLAVVDAFRLSKASVDYGRSVSRDQCVGCKAWQGHRQMQLSPCAIVEGLVRHDRWCNQFPGTIAGATNLRLSNGNQDQAKSQGADAQGPGQAGGGADNPE